jgi:hypothetical protein
MSDDSVEEEPDGTDVLSRESREKVYRLGVRPRPEQLVFECRADNMWGTPANAFEQVSGPLSSLLGAVQYDVKVRAIRHHQFLIVVPKPTSGLYRTIAMGSGIVALLEGFASLTAPELPGDRLVSISYEGAVHGQKMSFEDKLFQAASRQVERYSTIARAAVSSQDLYPVGLYALSEDYRDKQMWIWDQILLDDWRQLEAHQALLDKWRQLNTRI